MGRKPWRFAPLRRVATVALVVAVGAGAGLGAMALLEGGSGGPRRRPPTPSVIAFRFPTGGVVHPVAAEPETEEFAEPTSARAALEDFLGAERDGRPTLSYRLLTSGDKQDAGSAAAWTASSPERPQPLRFAVMAERPSADGAAVTVDVSRHSSLDHFGGFVSARATQVWDVVHEGRTWRVRGEPLSEDPVLPPLAGAADVAVRWVRASAACDGTARVALEGVPNLTGPEDLLAAPCAERGSWTVAGQPAALDRAPDSQAFVEAYGPDVGTWLRLVAVRGPRTHFFVALAPLGGDWRVIGVTSDGG